MYAPGEIEPCYEFYHWMLRMLLAVHSLECKENEYDSDCFVDIVRQLSIKQPFVMSKYHAYPRPRNTDFPKSQLYYLKAQDLMDSLTGSRDEIKFQLLSQMSKILLSQAIQNETSKTNAMSRLSWAYLAALHFATSEYETVIDLCSKVIINQTTEEEEKEWMNAGCLLYIDSIARSIGLYLLFRKIKDNFHYDKRSFYLDLRLTPEAFAQYLIISSHESRTRPFSLSYDLQTTRFYPLDVYLCLCMSITSQKFSAISTSAGNVLRVHKRADPINKL